MISNLWLWVGVIVISFIISLLFEDVRDYYSEIFEYIVEFEWLSDIGEFFSTIFENMAEFSLYGLVFGALTTIALYLLSDYTLAPFLVYYSPGGQILWGTVTYLGTFIGGYFMGVFFENS